MSPEPVDRRSEWAEQVARLEEGLHHVHGVERVGEVPPPAGVRAKRVTLLDGPQRNDEAERHRDRPRKRESERRRVPVGQQLDGDDARGRREQRVLERAETQDADSNGLIAQSRLLEGVNVDGKAAARHERTEPRRHGCDDVASPEVAIFFDPRDLAVGEDVPDVRERLRAECRRKPDRVDRPEARRDVVEAGHPGDGEERPQSDCRRCSNEHERLRPGSFKVALKSEYRQPLPGVTQARMHW